MAPPTPSEARFIETRLALQSVAEHVVCAARHAATGRIGLRSAPGGFATPAFPNGDGQRVLAVDGTELVVRDGEVERRAMLTSVGAAAQVVGIVAGAPTEVFTPTTPLEPDAPLRIDADVAATFAAWWALVDEALAVFAAEQPEGSVEPAQLWPEHFDLATTIDEVNYGGSPGDSSHELPYLYVGPWTPPEPDGDFWNRPFGAALPATEVTAVADALDFFREGQRRLAQSSG
jgi:hypothetical protein